MFLNVCRSLFQEIHWVQTVNECIAGQGETCTHVAAFPFALENCTNLGIVSLTLYYIHFFAEIYKTLHAYAFRSILI